VHQALQELNVTRRIELVLYHRKAQAPAGAHGRNQIEPKTLFRCEDHRRVSPHSPSRARMIIGSHPSFVARNLCRTFRSNRRGSLAERPGGMESPGPRVIRWAHRVDEVGSVQFRTRGINAPILYFSLWISSNDRPRCLENSRPDKIGTGLRRYKKCPHSISG